MDFVLNGVTIKSPVEFSRNQVEVAVDHVTLSGRVRRDITRQKEIFVLDFRNLTVSQMEDIIEIYNLKDSVSFVVSDLSINTTVWMRIVSRVYNARGTDYRENIILELEEV